MNKQKLIPILSGLLVVQLLLAAGLHFGGKDYSATAGEKLLTVDITSIDGMSIMDDINNEVELRKDGELWQVVKYDFAANNQLIVEFLERFSEIEKGWPVASTADAAKRFKVSEKDFERKVTFTQGGKTIAELLIGASKDLHTAYTRLADKNDIHLIEYHNLYDVSGSADDWIDKSVIERNIADIAYVKLPTFTLNRAENGELTVDKLKADQETNSGEADALLSRITGLQIFSVLGKENKPEFRQDKPDFIITLGLKTDQEIVYSISKSADASHYVLKSSDQENYYKIASYLMNPILETKLDQLVQAKQPDEPVAE